MGRPKLCEGLIWRQNDRRPGEYQEHIYFKKRYRGRNLRGSSGTSNPKEAERRLRHLLKQIDDQDIYGKAPDRTFREGAEKLIKEFQGSDKTLRLYAQQIDILMPYVGDLPLRLICRDTLSSFIDARTAKGVAPRTINMGIEVVRRVLRLAAHYWRDQGIPWITSCPIIPFEKGPRKKPYPLSWQEQERFLDALPVRKRKMALFDVNTGLRDRALTSLQWSWERFEESLGESVFEIPETHTKNGKPMVVVMNRIARNVLESMRGVHDTFVFGETSQMTDSTWQRAWREAGLPIAKNVLKGVHNLRHTFATRLRNEGVDERDVQDLLHHVPKTVTRMYSAPLLRNLKAAVERIVPKPQLVVGPKVGPRAQGADTTKSTVVEST